MIDALNSIFCSNTFDCIFIGGFVDIAEEFTQFHPNFKHLFFELSDKIIKLTKLDLEAETSKLSIRVVDEFDNEVDFEDVKPCRSKIDEIVFNDPLVTNRVKSVIYYNLKEVNGGIQCDALELELDNGQMIFFDPTFLGINIGGEAVKKSWLNNLKQIDDIKLTRFNFMQ